MLRYARRHEPKREKKKGQKRKKKAATEWAQRGVPGGTE